MLFIRKVWMACLVLFVCQAQNKLPISSVSSSTINLLEEELEDESGEVANISGIFAASNDIYLRTIGFDFQGVFYNVRGVGPEQITFLLNGTSQNRLYDHRPAWSNWGGVDAIYRTQEQTAPLGSSTKTMGNALGVTSLTTRASQYKKGTRIGYAHSNRSYQNKITFTHVGNVNQWHYVVAGSKRWGSQGYKTGTAYDATSLMLSVERFVNKHHSLTGSFLYTPNKRGVAGAYTDEVLDLKNDRYNANWGYQNGKKRNARIRSIEEPLFLLTHAFQKSDVFQWQNTLLLQHGSIGNSRIDFNGGSNPDPSYYQNLPSYWLSRNRVDYENVYRYQQEFLKEGQLDWNFLYQANTERNAVGLANAYVLYEDRREERNLQLHSNIERKINAKWNLNASIAYRNTVASNYAKILDLLGGNGYLDVANFTQAQSDVNHPNRLVLQGDAFKYNYKINSHQVQGFVQTLWKSKRLELSQAVGLSYTTHQRKGIYQYENEIDSKGFSKKIPVLAKQWKASGLYKFSGRNLMSYQVAYLQNAPNVKQIFPNARVSNVVLPTITTENMFTNALNFYHRGIKNQFKLTGYYNLQSNLTETGFYFAEGFGTDAKDTEANSGDLLDENSLFVQEVLSQIKKEYFGLEFGGVYKLTTSLKLTTVLGLGSYRYANNPTLWLFTEQSNTAQRLGFVGGRKNLGEASLKNKKLATGPQQAYALKFSYTDPNYWRLDVSVNHFRNNYVDIAPIKYTSNFTTEINGSVIPNIDPKKLALFRAQEKLNNFTLIHLTGGKSWKIKSGYVSFFWTLQNILDVGYKTGGFTSSRPANYSEQLKEFGREKPLFANRYFTGNGRTFFMGIYYSI